jgi:hypothetical protein
VEVTFRKLTEQRASTWDAVRGPAVFALLGVTDDASVSEAWMNEIAEQLREALTMVG